MSVTHPPIRMAHVHPVARRSERVGATWMGCPVSPTTEKRECAMVDHASRHLTVGMRTGRNAVDIAPMDKNAYRNFHVTLMIPQCARHFVCAPMAAVQVVPPVVVPLHHLPVPKVPVLRLGATDVLRVFPARLIWGLTAAVRAWWIVVVEVARLALSPSTIMAVPAVPVIVRGIVFSFSVFRILSRIPLHLSALL